MTRQAAIDRLQMLLSRVQRRAQMPFVREVPFVEPEVDSDEREDAVVLPDSSSALQSDAATGAIFVDSAAASQSQSAISTARLPKDVPVGMVGKIPAKIPVVSASPAAHGQEVAPFVDDGFGRIETVGDGKDAVPLVAPAPADEHVDSDGWDVAGQRVGQRVDEATGKRSAEADKLVDKLVHEAAVALPHLFEPVEKPKKPPISDEVARAVDDAIDEALLAAAQSFDNVSADQSDSGPNVDAAKECGADDAVAVSLTTADNPCSLAREPESPEAKAPPGDPRGVSAADDIEKTAEIVAEIIAEQDAQARASVASPVPTTLQINVAGVMITSPFPDDELSDAQVAAYRNSLTPCPADTFLQAIERSLALHS